MRCQRRSVVVVTRARRTNSIPVSDAKNGPTGSDRATASQGSARTGGVIQASRQSSTRGIVRSGAAAGTGSGRAEIGSGGLLMRTGTYQPWVVLAVDCPNHILMLP